ncbi:MAG: multifunctional CCA tRNA nucleotidyl transferase/2'3'-cyclic phosphodiesterase/2'nucleotidase/phosphatase [Coxiellaceae bacterium]|nr:multifunctional CCA tRNA nucleotidyl transferase/2'3'-cyclic phosphodiesterase/2'nucleotidase/phosphatase [Coxiellaceae bacterium]
MEIYLVGGAVRDELLGKPIKEKDWVVVGCTPEEMLKKGFQPVGKDFPVFLHPKTHEEYALARTERKTGKGYKGFHFYATPDVTLDEDLIRRDLTINAMAKALDGKIIDPYHGQADLQKKLFRHVSPAFSEDPVRILRIARFATTFPDFQVHPDTNALMNSMVQAGEVDALVSERVWKELSRALLGNKPTRFFEVLKNCDALFVLFPEFKNPAWCLSYLENAVENGPIRFSLLLQGLTEKEIKTICARFRVPTEFTELALLVEKYHEKYHLLRNDADDLWEIIKCCDAFRRPERFSEWIVACRKVHTIDHEKVLLNALAAAKSVDTKRLVAQNIKGPAFAEALKILQIEAIRICIKQKYNDQQSTPQIMPSNKQSNTER